MGRTVVSRGKTALTFAIFEGLLTGTAGGKFFMEHARSGGGGGSTAGKAEPGIVNNPYMQQRKSSKANKVRGGPLPVGKYFIHRPAVHPRLGRACFLEPANRRQMGDRDGMFIHGRGKLGSDGCIVPLGRFTELLDGIDQDGGGVLFVVESSSGSMFA